MRIPLLVSALALVMSGCVDGAEVPSPAEAGTPMLDGAASQLVPVGAGELHAWLRAGRYMSFRGESSVHPSTGPHGRVRTFVNNVLAASLDEGRASHPRGSAAIKELYSSDGVTLAGWSVEVKVSSDSDGGSGWYWYEVFDTKPGAIAAFEGTGVRLCTNCHANGAKDYFKSRWPPP